MRVLSTKGVVTCARRTFLVGTVSSAYRYLFPRQRGNGEFEGGGLTFSFCPPSVFRESLPRT